MGQTGSTFYFFHTYNGKLLREDFRSVFVEESNKHVILLYRHEVILAMRLHSEIM